MTSCEKLVAKIAPALNDADRAAIHPVILTFGEPLLERCAKAHIQIVPLSQGQRYREISPALMRLGIDVDAWPAPPAGLFVVEERTVFIRSRSPMTIAHEFGHAVDCMLGDGIYQSGTDRIVRDCFHSARSFITGYAASSLDEYFAESFRAYVEINDPACSWPNATKARLRRIDPTLYSYIKHTVKHGVVPESIAA